MGKILITDFWIDGVTVLIMRGVFCDIKAYEQLLIFLLQDPSLLDGRVTLHHVKAGSVVARQGDQV